MTKLCSSHTTRPCVMPSARVRAILCASARVFIHERCVLIDPSASMQRTLYTRPRGLLSEVTNTQPAYGAMLCTRVLNPRMVEGEKKWYPITALWCMSASMHV